jgi:hypothetical protein
MRNLQTVLTASLLAMTLLAWGADQSDIVNAQLLPGSLLFQKAPTIIWLDWIANQTIDGEPVSLALSSSLNTGTGDFKGTYTATSRPGTVRVIDPDMIADTGWELKGAMPIGDDVILGTRASIVGLGRFHVDVASKTTTRSGAFQTTNVTLSGHPAYLTVRGTSTARHPSPPVPGSALVSSFTEFSPDAPGRIAFRTEHAFASGDVQTTTGVIALVGNPDAQLKDTVCADFSLSVTQTDTDNSDGILSGEFSGRTALSSSLCR